MKGLVELTSLITRHLNAGTYSPEQVAAEFYEIPRERVTPEQRYRVKQFAHGFVYGAANGI